MGNRHHSTGETLQELLQPIHRFRIQMVGRLVQQQHVGLRKQQLAQCHATFFTTRQDPDLGVPRRQSQGIGSHFQLLVQAIAIGRSDNRFEPRLLGCQRIEISIFFGISGIHGIQFGLCFKHFAERALHFLTHGLFGIQLRFLGQIADVQVGHRNRFAFDFLVDASHDLEQSRFTRAVQAEHTDLGTGEKGQRNVLEDLPLGRHDLADAVHCKYVLSHG